MTTSPERIRVLSLLDGFSGRSGGAERFALSLALHLPRDRFDVTLCTSRPSGGELLMEARAAGLRHVALNRRGRADVVPWVRLTRLLARERFHVLHAHKFGSNVWGVICGRAARVPAVVAHEHTWSYEGAPLRRAIDRELIARFADAFVAVSGRDRERMISIEGVPPQKIVVLPTGYIPRAAKPSSDLRAELGVQADHALIGTVAVLRPQKALDVLLEAFANVAAVVERVQLVIAGDGPVRAELERRAEELGIADRTRFLGYRTDVGAVLAALDLAVMSSDYEGSPLFAFECMAHRTPLVSTDVGGLADILVHGESVVLVPRREPGALAAAIVRLLEAPDLRASLVEAAARRLTGFEMPAVARRFGDLYESLLSSDPAD